jgi:hypothetical protein
MGNVQHNRAILVPVVGIPVRHFYLPTGGRRRGSKVQVSVSIFRNLFAIAIDKGPICDKIRAKLRGLQSMLAPTSCPDAGRRLRAERERLRLSTRDVERMSQAIALSRNDSDYYISHTWVADVEAGKFKPKLYKLHSLSLIYQRSLDEILGFFGLDVRQVGQEHGLAN